MRLFLVIVLILITLTSCTTGLPDKSTDDYRETISAFYVGLAALQVGDDQRARTELEKAAVLAPGEPAVWNNLGVLQLRAKDFEIAAESFEKARGLASANALIYSNQAVLETQRGNFDAAIANLNKAIELNPKDIRSAYTLGLEKERQTNEAEALALYERISEEKPDNLAIKLEVVRLTAKLGDTAKLGHLIAGLDEIARNWPAEAKDQFSKLKESAAKSDVRQAATDVVFLKNVLIRLPSFRADLAEIKPSETVVGEPFQRPLTLQTPEFKPAEADLGLTFSGEATIVGQALFAKPFFSDGDNAPVVLWSDEENIHIGKSNLPFSVSSSRQTAAIDFDYDFKNDLAVAGKNGFRLFKQTAGGEFEDVTEQTKISAGSRASSYVGVWVLDVDNEGDLDLMLAPEEGPPIVLQNNGDGTFSETKPFPNAENIIDFVYADFDEDGDSDAVLLNAKGKLHLFLNERGGLFEEKLLPELDPSVAITAGDSNGDSKIDLVTVLGNKTVSRVSLKTGSGEIEVNNLVEGDVCGTGDACVVRMMDIDNNGANDILISDKTAASVFLTDSSAKYIRQPTGIKASISDFTDMNTDGKLDLIGIDSDGKPTVFQNNPTKNYHWQVLRPKAQKTEGDQRINTFGIGGEMEIRSGLLAQKQIIGSPQVHFGLGELEKADVLRVIWQNGYVQAEFDLRADQTIAAEQRLKGSCPHLFTWNGEKFELVKDAPPWSPALGLKINAQDTYGVLQTEEWFKIPGESLKAKDGFYDLRITAEYWESFYLDSYSLLVVDHPEGTEIFTDERFAIPLPPLKVFTTDQTRPFSDAVDQNGLDVSEKVSELDDVYLDSIKLGKYQGVAEEHFVELELPENPADDKRLWLVADGWVHPTDASINVQRGQGNPNPPKSLSIEIQDENGVWTTVRENLGFPAGKMKTILLDLSDIFPKNAPKRRFRLKTEMEIYWDKLAWAADIDGNENRVQTLEPAAADLRYRGFSVIGKANDSSPEKPSYEKILTTGQRWRDLEGFYTRFGDVRELLLKSDDRYVLSNAGDELILKFPALPDVEPGWKRDFVIIGNGWIKDGDLNSVYSRTLLPLPTRATNDYTRRPTVLEDDPVYRQNSTDWFKFHTRYVAPDNFRNALRQSVSRP